MGKDEINKFPITFYFGLAINRAEISHKTVQECESFNGPENI